MRRILTLLVAALVVTVAVFWLAGRFAMSSSPHSYVEATDAQKTAARDYLAANNIPLPDGWSFQTFEREPGVPLRAGRARVPDAKGTVVIVPGHTAPLDVYGLSMRELTAAGYSVAGLEQRGQGHSWRPLDNPEKSYQADYGDLSADLAAYVATLTEDGPVFLLGNSMGGHIALRALGEHETGVRGAALIVPMVDIITGEFPYWAARAMSSFYALTGLGENYSPGGKDWRPDEQALDEPGTCNPNPETTGLLNAMRTLDPKLRVRSTTNQWVHATMASVGTITDPAFVARIDEPVFMVTAGREAYVSTPAAAQLCDGLKRCERKHFEEAAHCIISEDRERGRAIMADVIAFYDAQLR